MLWIIQMRVHDRSEKRIWLVIFLSYLKKNHQQQKTKLKLFKAVIVDRVLILLPLKQKHSHSEEQNVCLWQTHVLSLSCSVAGKVNSQTRYLISPPQSGTPDCICILTLASSTPFSGPLFFLHFFFYTAFIPLHSPALALHQKLGQIFGALQQLCMHKYTKIWCLPSFRHGCCIRYALKIVAPFRFPCQKH